MIAPAVRILLVDDEPDIRRTLQAMLEHKGYQVETAANCRQAIELVSRSTQMPYRAAIIDIRLPDGLGTDVLKTVKRLTPQTTCFMVTAYPDEDTQRLSRDAGAQDYVAKPFSVEQLLASMQRSAPHAHHGLPQTTTD